GSNNYSVSAQIAEATGTNVTAGPNTFSVSTQPTMNALPAITNNTSQTFGGTKTGNGTHIRVCPQSAGNCTLGASICDITGISTTPGTPWTCTHTFAAGSFTLLAFQLDGSSNFSTASSPARP